MKANKIFVLGVLKPLNDVRNYHKWFKSLQTENFNVFISGRKINNFGFEEQKNFIPLKIKNRLSINRFYAYFTLLNKLFKIKPDYIVLTTIEFVPFLYIYLLFNKSKIIYDIQENYQLNIKYGNNYITVVAKLLIICCDFFERLIKKKTTLFVLAEKCYKQEKKELLDGAKVVILENLPSREFNIIRTNDPGKPIVLYMGTISNIYGIKRVLNFFQGFKKNIAIHAELLIIGHITQKDTFQLFRDQFLKEEGVKLIVSELPISHEIIRREIANVTFAIMPYVVNKAIINRIPTKLFEYRLWKIPFLITNNPLWDNVLKEGLSGLSVDWENIDWEKIKIFLLKNNITSHNEDYSFWEDEFKKVLNLIN